MILQYFKKKENEYKKIADKIYIDILLKSKDLSTRKFFNNINFDSSFELISIITVFYFKKHKDQSIQNYKEINQHIINNFINDLDKTLREEGIGDMSIGKYVKKYVKKFYYRIKLLDTLLDNKDGDKLTDYLNTINDTNKNYSSLFSNNLMNLYYEIKKNNDFENK